MTSGIHAGSNVHICWPDAGAGVYVEGSEYDANDVISTALAHFVGFGLVELGTPQPFGLLLL
jgi:hypothetical protein